MRLPCFYAAGKSSRYNGTIGTLQSDQYHLIR